MPESVIEPEQLESILRRRRRDRSPDAPLMIGIGGGSAAGKSTLARSLAARLLPRAVEIVGQDRFFKPVAQLPRYPSSSRPQPWPDYNRPDSFRVQEMLDYCRSLKGAEVAILEGILVLHYPHLRRLMCLRLYVDADADERIVRRIRRNVQAGMDLDDIADYYMESVRFQHLRYNAPTREFADLVIPGGSRDRLTREALLDVVQDALVRTLD